MVECDQKQRQTALWHHMISLLTSRLYERVIKGPSLGRHQVRSPRDQSTTAFLITLLVFLVFFTWRLTLLEQRAVVLDQRWGELSAEVSSFTEDSRQFHVRATQAIEILSTPPHQRLVATSQVKEQ